MGVFRGGTIDALISLFRPARLDISWLTDALAVGAGPTSRAYRQLRRLDISTVVDLRTEFEREHDPSWEHAAGEAGITVRELPVTDRHPPTAEQLEQGCAWVLEALATDTKVLICCRVGAQRSATLATAVLVRMGYRLQDAFTLVSAARRIANPTDDQVAVLRAFASKRP